MRAGRNNGGGRRGSIRAIIAACLGVLGSGGVAGAGSPVTAAWTGAGSDNKFSTGANWSGGTVPQPGTVLLFNGFARLNPLNDLPADYVIGGVTFDPAAGPYVLTGERLTLGGDIIDNTPILLQGMNVPLLLSGNRVISVGDGGLLGLGGVISSAGDFGLSKTGNGTLVLGGANTFTGPVSITGGVMSVGSAASLGAAPAAPAAGLLTIDGGALRTTATMTLPANRGIALGPATGAGAGTFDVNAGSTLTYGGVIANNGGGAGGLDKIKFGTLSLSGANTYTGPTRVRNGGLVLNFADAAATTPVSNIISPSSNLVLGGATTGLGQNNNATLTMTGKAGTANTQTFAGTHVDIYGSVINVTNGASGGTATLNLGPLTHTTGGTVVIPTNSGTVTTTTTVANTNGILGGWAVAGTPDTQRGIVMGNAYATVDASGKIVPYTAHVAAPVYAPGDNATLLRNDPGIQADPDKNVRFTGSATSSLLRVDLENAGTTTDINTLAYTTGGAHHTLVIGTGNTLRLGRFGGIFKQANGNNQLYIGGSTDTPMAGNGTASSTTPSQVGVLTAGGPTLGTPGEIVLTTNETANNNGTLNIMASIVDNGPGGAVTLIKTSVSSVKIDGHNTYSGGTFINQGRFQLAGSEVGRRVNPAGGTDLTEGNPDGLGTGPVTIAPGGYLFLSGVNGTAVYTGRGAIPGAIANTAQNAPILNDLVISGNGTNQENIGAIRLGNRSIMTGQITLGGDARIGGGNAAAYPAINPDGTTLYVDQGNLLSGKITGPFSLDFGSGASVNTNLVISNPANDWSGTTTILGRSGGNARLRLGANDVIPDGVGKGNLLFNANGAATLDLYGFSETVNGLSSDGSATPGNAFVENNGFAATITDPTPADPNNNDKAYAFTSGVATLTVGGFDQSATFGGVIRDYDNSLSFTLPNPNFTGPTDPEGDPATLSIPASQALANAKVGLTKTGAGVQTLTGGNTYTGETNLNNGTLAVIGSLDATGAVKVNASAAGGGTLSGKGQVGNVTLSANSGGNVARLSPGDNAASGSVGKLQLSSLSVNGGDFQFDLVSPDTPAANDQLEVQGAVAFNGASTISPRNGSAGTYTLITSNGPITYTSVPTLNVVQTPGARTATYTLDRTTNPNALLVNVVGGAKNLTWTGAANSLWDTNGTANWTDGAVAEKFIFLDRVTFADGPANRNVTINTTVLPGQVSATNTAGNDYVLTGTAGIGGTTGLSKSGSGRLVLANPNSYSGLTAITGGVLQVGDGGASGSLGTGAVQNDAVLAFNRTDAHTVPNVISGFGELQHDGVGRTTLSGANTYSGPTKVNAGTVVVTNAATSAAGTVSSLGDGGGMVTVAPGAAVDLAGATQANSLNFGSKLFAISGTGVGGTGALTNSGTVGQQNAFQQVMLAGNASVGGTGRFDIRNAANSIANLDLQNFTLTKVGPGQFSLVGVNASNSDGSIVVEGGTLAIETTSLISDLGTGTITYKPGTTAQFFNVTGTVNKPMVFEGNNTIGNASAQPSTVASNMRLAGDVTFNALNDATGTLILTGVISETGGARSITKAGGNTLELRTAHAYTGGTTVNGGTLLLTELGSVASSSGVTVNNGGTFQPAVSTSVKALTVNNGGRASIPQDLVLTLTTNDLTVNAGGRVDVNNNFLVVQSTAAGAAADLARVSSYAGDGFSAGGAKPWSAGGLTSSRAAADADATGAGPTGIAVIRNSDDGTTPLFATFNNQPVDANSILVKLAYHGDTDLSGTVDANDYTRADRGFLSRQDANPANDLTGYRWGDFDHDGKTTARDFFLIDLANATHGGPLDSAAGPAAPVVLSAAGSPVPEPAALGLFALAAPALLRRRRRA